MKLVEAKGRNFDRLSSRAADAPGWHSSWGNPEIYSYFLPRIKEGQRVFDLGCGTGRNLHRLYFAGAEVVGVDSCEFIYSLGEEIRAEAGVDYPVIRMDAWEYLKDHGKGFDYIFAVDMLLHQKKSQAIARLGEIVEVMKPGALLYINAPSTESYDYELAQSMFPELEKDTFEMECGCSGEPKLEPVCFFYPGELELHLARLGTKIRLTKVAGDYEDEPLKSCVITEKVGR